WILLAAAAAVTERIRLGPMVTPLARRRPWVVARQAATLDHLSAGRGTRGVGGAARFAVEGSFHHLARMRFEPRPVQRPRIPIWVAGFWPARAPFRRAARWDGVFPASHATEETGEPMPLDELGAIL